MRLYSQQFWGAFWGKKKVQESRDDAENDDTKSKEGAGVGAYISCGKTAKATKDIVANGAHASGSRLDQSEQWSCALELGNASLSPSSASDTIRNAASQ